MEIRQLDLATIRDSPNKTAEAHDYSEPAILGQFSYSYSRDGKRTLHLDDSQLKYLRYKDPEIIMNGNLSEGYESWIKKPENLDEHLDGLLTVISSLQKSKKLSLSNINFITWRGVLTKIFCSAFTSTDAWKMLVMRKNDIILMTEDKSVVTGPTSDRQKLMTYWGHKFENICMAPINSISQQPNPSSVNTNEEYGIVFKSRLGQHRMILGAEVDGLDRDKQTFIELKTTRQFTNQHTMDNFFRHKALKYWLQSYLAGIRRLLVGMRDDHGHLTEVRWMGTGDIAAQAKVHNPTGWSPEAVLISGSRILTWIRESMELVPIDEVVSIVFDPTLKTICLHKGEQIDSSIFHSLNKTNDA